jgi:hypothetical protein
MTSDLKLMLVGWVALTLVVVALAIYRRTIARPDDHLLHVNNFDSVPQQVSVVERLQVIDRWGKGLTILSAIYGLVILGMYIYAVWEATSRAY